jgi:hypothetical protein
MPRVEDKKIVGRSRWPEEMGMLRRWGWTVFFGLIILWFVFLNRDFISGWFSHITPAPADSIRGEWVGQMHIYGIRDPGPRDIQKDAVIRFKLGITDSFLKKYGGRGELTIAGEKPQGIEVKDLWPQTDPGDNSFETGIWLDSYKPDDNSDPVSGGFSGTFIPGVLSLEKDNDLGGGYAMRGTLKKGTDADYESLVSQMAQRANVAH